MHELTELMTVVSPFLMVVVIVWVTMHYRTRRRELEAQQHFAGKADARLLEVAEKMERRIESLEQILDAEAPGWRKRHEHS